MSGDTYLSGLHSGIPLSGAGTGRTRLHKSAPLPLTGSLHLRPMLGGGCVLG